MSTANFTHLHVHSEYSLLDGACRLKELIRTAKSYGMSHLALTDHGVMHGSLEFYQKRKQKASSRLSWKPTLPMAHGLTKRQGQR